MSVAIRMSVLSLILVLAYCFDSEEGEFEDYEIEDPGEWESAAEADVAEEDEWESEEEGVADEDEWDSADVGVMESNEQNNTVEEHIKVQEAILNDNEVRKKLETTPSPSTEQFGHEVGSEKNDTVEEHFKEANLNHTGELDYVMMKNELESTSSRTTEFGHELWNEKNDTVEERFKEADLNQNGELDYAELAKAVDAHWNVSEEFFESVNLVRDQAKELLGQEIVIDDDSNPGIMWVGQHYLFGAELKQHLLGALKKALDRDGDEMITRAECDQFEKQLLGNWTQMCFKELNNNGFHKLKLAYAEGGVADQFLKPMFVLIGAVNINKWVETMSPKDQQEVFGMGYLEKMAHEADADKDGLLSLKEAKTMVMKVAAKAHKSG